MPSVIQRPCHYFDATGVGPFLWCGRIVITALKRSASSSKRGIKKVALGQTRDPISATADAIGHADNAVTFRYGFKAIAQQHNLFAPSMPKPWRASMVRYDVHRAWHG